MDSAKLGYASLENKPVTFVGPEIINLSGGHEKGRLLFFLCEQKKAGKKGFLKFRGI